MGSQNGRNNVSKKPTPNDDRSRVKNPVSKDYAADRANRVAQGHAAPPPPPASSAEQQSPPEPRKKQ